MELKEMVKRFADCQYNLTYCKETGEIINRNNDLFYLYKRVNENAFEYQVVDVWGRTRLHSATVVVDDEGVKEYEDLIYLLSSPNEEVEYEEPEEPEMKMLYPIDNKPLIDEECYEERMSYLRDHLYDAIDSEEDDFADLLIARQSTLNALYHKDYYELVSNKNWWD